MPNNTEIVNGNEIETIPLQVIDYDLLQRQDGEEIKRLSAACQMPGFFYLDLRSNPPSFVPELSSVYALSRKYFDEPGEDGGGSQPAKKQKMFEITRDNLLSSSVEYPPPLHDHSETLSDFSALCHTISLSLLGCLSDTLSLKGHDRFEYLHRDDTSTGSAFNLIYAPTRPKRADHPDTTHTDEGTLTLLFSNEWGVMVEDPETKRWGFVKPRGPEVALVNVGDALQRVSGGKFHSCRHAISQVADGFEGRYFAVSYLRPEK